MIVLFFFVFFLISSNVVQASQNSENSIRRRRRGFSSPRNLLKTIKDKIPFLSSRYNCESFESENLNEQERNRSYSCFESFSYIDNNNDKNEEDSLNTPQTNLSSLSKDNNVYEKMDLGSKFKLHENCYKYSTNESTNKINQNILFQKPFHYNFNSDSSKQANTNKASLYKNYSTNKEIKNIMRRSYAGNVNNSDNNKGKRRHSFPFIFSLRRKSANANISYPQNNDSIKDYGKYAVGGIFTWSNDDISMLRIFPKRKGSLTLSIECNLNLNEEGNKDIKELYILCVNELDKIENQDIISEDKINNGSFFSGEDKCKDIYEQNFTKCKKEELKRCYLIFKMYDINKKQARKKRLIRSYSVGDIDELEISDKYFHNSNTNVNSENSKKKRTTETDNFSVNNSSQLSLPIEFIDTN
ncbi:conserved Plasmodium protein, unknown function [Plasmodium relictum]|uniref:Uncharacterized protein n=1 Tax=Plasmodium relictum TaxID=85471 RepID=A0A1J1H8W3_PLARL|nr:conserved Plasmodium protein, unknown function [Plasmodium relictum]CRG99880.1 conserved Plasmodium protein, unknown function [Plasmodium relictum]